MTLPRKFATVFGIVLCTSCASNSRDGVLKALSTDLAVVRSAPKNASFEKPSRQDVGVLRGMTVGEIQRALGEPDCLGTPTNRCLDGATLAYDFFYLPPGWRGGGATLVVHVDSGERCRAAQWFWTK
jgi:hypothetical protein